MANLLVRNVDKALFERLRERAASSGRSVEAEHREILEKALPARPRRTFAEMLLSMPDVGDDADFARVDH